MRWSFLHPDALEDLKAQLKALGFDPYDRTPGFVCEINKPALTLQPEYTLGKAYAEFDQKCIKHAKCVAAAELASTYEQWTNFVLSHEDTWGQPRQLNPRNTLEDRIKSFGVPAPWGAVANLILSDPSWNAYQVKGFSTAVAMHAAEFAYFVAFFWRRSFAELKVGPSTVCVVDQGRTYGVLDRAVILPDGSRMLTDFSADAFFGVPRAEPLASHPIMMFWDAAHKFLLEFEAVSTKQEQDISWALWMLSILRWTYSRRFRWRGAEGVAHKRYRVPKPFGYAAKSETKPIARIDKHLGRLAIEQAIHQLSTAPWTPEKVTYDTLRAAGFGWRTAVSVTGGYSARERKKRPLERAQEMIARLESLQQQLEEEAIDA